MRILINLCEVLSAIGIAIMLLFGYLAIILWLNRDGKEQK